MARQLEEAFFRSSCLNPRRDDDGGIETPSSAAAGTVRFGKVFLLIFAFAAGWVCSWSRAGMRDLWGVTHNAYGNERPDPADGAKAGFPVDSHKGPVRSKMWGQSGVVLPFFQPRQLMGVEENPASDEKPAGGSSRPRGAEPSPKTSLTSSLSLKDEVLPPKKKEVVKLRVLNPHMFRAELCPFLRIGDSQIKSWYALLVLYIAEWPAYAQTGNGGERFLDQLRAFSEHFVPPENTTSQGRVIFQDEIDCGTPKVFREGLDTIKGELHNFDDLVRLLKAVAKAESDFANLLDYTQYSKLPTRAAVTGFALILRTAFEGMVFSFCRTLFLKNGNKGNFNRNELYSNVVWLYHRNQTQYWMLLLVAKIIKQIVSARPHSGIIILKSVLPSRAAHASASETAPDSDAGGKEPVLKTLYGVGGYSTLQKIVAGAIWMKLEGSLSRFQNLSTERGMLSTAKGVLQPKVFVTGYYAKNSKGVAVEEGLFGMEVESETLEELKEDLEPNSVLLQISLVDEWNFKDPKEWPDPRKSEIDVLTAHTAVQMLRAELEWDPSLGSLGAFSVAYTGFTDIYARQRTDPEGHFDPDVNLLVVDDITRFIQTGTEEGCKEKIINLIAEEPLQIKRVFDHERIVVKGTAKVLPGGDVFMKGNFGLGLSLELQHEAEKLLKQGSIMVHVYIKGLGKRTSETNDLDLTASEMVNRLVLRSRGYYDIPIVKTVTPMMKVAGEARPTANCSDKVPEWVVVVSSCSIAVFFIVIIALLMYHERMKLPWWLNCICSSTSPWGDEEGTIHRDRTAAEIPSEYYKSSVPEATVGTVDIGSNYDEVDGRGWLPATAKWVGDKSLSVKSINSFRTDSKVPPAFRPSRGSLSSADTQVGGRSLLEERSFPSEGMPSKPPETRGDEPSRNEVSP